MRSLQKVIHASVSEMPAIEKIRKRHMMKKKAQRQLLEQLTVELDTEISNLDTDTRLEEGILDDGSRIILMNGEILFFEEDKMVIPTLRAILDGIVEIPKIAVDMGAVRFVANGADIMRPGVTKIDSKIKQGSVVAIVDETHGKPLAVGIAKMNAEEMESAKGGKVVLSKHYVGDPLWEFGKT
jgi:PUA domain protein